MRLYSYLRVSDRTTALHSIRVAGRRAHRVSYGVLYHQFDDDTQLLVAINVTDAGPALERLANCSTAVRLWFLHNDLQLNSDKSQVVILGTAPQLRSAASIREVEVAGSRLQVAPKLKLLGVTTWLIQ